MKYKYTKTLKNINFDDDCFQENQEGGLCVICFENAPDAVFMPCGHGGVCYECALDMFKSSNECYLGRKVNFMIFSYLYFKPVDSVL